MKKIFSTSWKASKQPRKQRKFKLKSPLHLKKKFVSINLSKELRKKQGKRNLQAKKGDVVKIMNGKFKGKSGKILKVNLKQSKIIVDGIQTKKQDGSKANIKLQPSNLQIIELSERLNSQNIKEKGKEISEKKQESKKETIKRTEEAKK